MSKKIQLTIADPCHESWDQMTAAKQGRFCASCQKQVVDFSNMSDSQLAAFFKKPSGDSVCGRFFHDQLDRDIEIPRKRIPWVKYFFQFALPAFLLSAKATAQGKVKAKIISSTAVAPTCSKIMGDVEPVKRKILTGDTIVAPIQKQKEPGTLLSGQINLNNKPIHNLMVLEGTVVDRSNSPVPYATVMIKGTKKGMMADSIGAFKIDISNLQKEIILQVSSVGYEAKEIVIVNEADLLKYKVIQLTRQVLGEVVVVASSQQMIMGGIGVRGVLVKKYATDSLVSVIKSPSETLPMIKVYPNPVVSGTNINVGCQKLKEGYYNVQLSNQAGQQVLFQQTWIDAEAQVLNIDIPFVAAGVYFLKLTNKETSKRFTAKVIVE